MKKKLLATAIAGALVAPGAFAAQDTSGMRYTSAAEGFYSSIRVRFATAGTDDDGASIENSSSRFGVRGSNDLGGGLEGFYQYEAGVGIDNGSGLTTRVAHVGLRGAFGQLQVGTFWPQSYNWVHGTTDVANVASGSVVYSTLLPGRQSRALEYTTPDLNGFQASGFVELNDGTDGEGDITTEAGDASDKRSDIVADVLTRAGANSLVREVASVAAGNDITLESADAAARSGTAAITATTPVIHLRDSDGNYVSVYDVDSSGTVTTDDWVVTGVSSIPSNPKDDNDIDLWSLSAKYSIQGFDAGVSYTVKPDGIAKAGSGQDDLSLYAVRLGYAQDNWYVTSWYSEDDAGDAAGATEDTETFSVAAGVAVGKVNVYAIYDNQESDNGEPANTGTNEDEYTTFGVQYNLGSRSRVWIEYAGRDLETDDDADDYINIGLRHDF